MDPLILILIAVGVFVLLALLRSGSKRKAVGPPRNYELRRGLFTRAERSFLGVLDQAVGNDYRVFGKVRVADVLKVSREVPKAGWQAAFNKINGKHFDFVLADPATLDVKVVIELNDKSHRSEKRAARDQFIRETCAGADLRLIEVEAKRAYSVAEVRELLKEPALPDPDGRVEPKLS
ncbi:MAG: DUF2726 domain-containing protein [Woeseiaceae bacterium]|nr:DUF2726 domain-containing protein [Woeseiaceae bacterium]